MGNNYYLMHGILVANDCNFIMEFNMKMTRKKLESDPFINVAKAQDILNRTALNGIARGHKVVRVSRVFTDENCRQRRIIDEVGIYEHC